MIIRSNLASVPIKNYSLFLLASFVLAILVVGFTLWNLINLKNSYSQTAELKRNITNQQTLLRDLETKQKALQEKITRIKTPQFLAETDFMNNAIKRRTFSWTALFDHFEEMLPPTVRMVSISPLVTDTGIAINVEMSAQSLTDMLELVRVMERDPAFSQVVLKGENTGTDEQILFLVSLNYAPLQQPMEDPSNALSSSSDSPRLAAGEVRGGDQ